MFSQNIGAGAPGYDMAEIREGAANACIPVRSKYSCGFPLERCKLLTRWAFEYFDQTPSPTSSSPTEVGSSVGQPTLAAAPSTVPPAIVSPESGEEVSSQSPLLTVKNATTDGEPTYTFQVASDRGFNDIVARAGGIPEGSGRTDVLADSEEAERAEAFLACSTRI